MSIFSHFSDMFSVLMGKEYINSTLSVFPINANYRGGRYMKYLAVIMLLFAVNSEAITYNKDKSVTLSPKELEQLKKYQDDVTNTIINKELIIIEQQKQIEKLKAMRNCV